MERKSPLSTAVFTGVIRLVVVFAFFAGSGNAIFESPTGTLATGIRVVALVDATFIERCGSLPTARFAFGFFILTVAGILDAISRHLPCSRSTIVCGVPIFDAALIKAPSSFPAGPGAIVCLGVPTTPSQAGLFIGTGFRTALEAVTLLTMIVIAILVGRYLFHHRSWWLISRGVGS